MELALLFSGIGIVITLVAAFIGYTFGKKRRTTGNVRYSAANYDDEQSRNEESISPPAEAAESEENGREHEELAKSKLNDDVRYRQSVKVALEEQRKKSQKDAEEHLNGIDVFIDEDIESDVDDWFHAKYRNLSGPEIWERLSKREVAALIQRMHESNNQITKSMMAIIIREEYKLDISKNTIRKDERFVYGMEKLI